jgi:hypothetical protein
VISYRAQRRAVIRAERAEAIGEQVRAELARARAHYEAVADGTQRGYFGLTPERAAEIVAEWDRWEGLRPDPEPAHLRPSRPADRSLPVYMPPGAPRPMSLRETVRALNALGSRVPLSLQLRAAGMSPRQMRRALAALARRGASGLAERGPGYVGLSAGEGSPRLRVLAQWLDVCLRTGPPALAAARPVGSRIAAHCMGAPVIGP